MSLTLTLPDSGVTESALTLPAGERLILSLNGAEIGEGQWLTLAATARGPALLTHHTTGGKFDIPSEALAPLKPGGNFRYNLWCETGGEMVLRGAGPFRHQPSIRPSQTSGGTNALPVYWGASEAAVLDAAGVIALPGEELATPVVRDREMVIDASGGRYVFYAYPASLGVPAAVKAYGFVTEVVTAKVTLSLGGTEVAYLVLRLLQAQNGPVSLEVS